MQNVGQGSSGDNPKLDKVKSQHDIAGSSTPHSTTSSPAKSETETYSEHPRFMTDTSESEEDSVSEVESFIIDRTDLDEDPRLEKTKFLLSAEEADRSVDPETQARLEALLHAAGISQLATKDGKHLADPEVLRRLTSSVSCALDEAAAALTRMRTDNPRSAATGSHATPGSGAPPPTSDKTSLVEACTDGDVNTVKKLLTEGRSVQETTEEGESLLSLACSAGYFELAQVLLAMHANVEDRGIKGECTPLMEAASAGHVDIVRLLIAHGADVNAQSTSGNTPLMYACAGGHEEAVEILLDAGANVEDHNENGHTPLMEAASAGHVNVAKILLRHGAGINTHSNEFKESALTLACYKGHLDMVRFLLEAGADQEHKTDEMHTALMEASMDGHVEVARLLLDSGAQVNMPTDSFESPLTLAACGGHVDLAMLLIERGANIEEVNDEGYTPLMEAAREGHEEMVALLLSQGANINAQTDETQETALTLACCGGFSEVADFLIKAGADIELGASTPLMEAAQEGHLELVKYLLHSNANVHAQTQTGDTALTYACENGHTDVADLLLECNADLEHESEGGRTPLMKACRAGHLCTVQFLISKGADVNRQTTNNDHTPLSLACAGGHLAVVELLLSHQADPFHKLKDNSTMLIEAAKGGHTSVVQLLLDYPHSILMTPSHQPQQPAPPATLPVSLPPTITVAAQPFLHGASGAAAPPPDSLPCQGLHEVPEAVRIVAQDEPADAKQPATATSRLDAFSQQPKQKSLLRKNRAGIIFDGSLTSAEAQQVRTQPLGELSTELGLPAAAIELLSKEDASILDKGSTSGSIVEYIKARKKQFAHDDPPPPAPAAKHSAEEHILQKQQILEELHRVERELQVKAPNHLVVNTYGMGQGDALPALPGLLNIELASHTIASSQGMVCGGTGMTGALFHQPTSPTIYNNYGAFYAGKSSQISSQCLQQQTQQQPQAQQQQQQQQQAQAQVVAGLAVSGDTGFAPTSFAYTPASMPLTTSQQPQITPITAWQQAQPPQHQPPQPTITASAADVSQTTAISDRPKAKPVSKKEGKNLRKQQAYQTALQQQHLQQINQQLQQQVLQQQQSVAQQEHRVAAIQQAVAHQQVSNANAGVVLTSPIVNIIDSPTIVQQAQQSTPQQSKLDQHQSARILQGDASDLVGLLTDQDGCHLFTDATDKTKLDNVAPDLDTAVDDVTLDPFSLEDVANVAAAEQEKLQMAAAVQQAAAGLQVQSFPSNLDEAINAIAAAHNSMQVGATQTDVARVEYFAVPATNTQLPALQVGHGPPANLQLQYEQYLHSVNSTSESSYQAGFQAGLKLIQKMNMGKTSQPLACSGANGEVLSSSMSAGVQQQVVSVGNTPQFGAQATCSTHQVQVATQTQQPMAPTSTASTPTPAAPAPVDPKKQMKATAASDVVKVKKGRLLMQRQQPNHLSGLAQQAGQFSSQTPQNFQIDPNTVEYFNAGPQQYGSVPQTSFSCMDVDSETDSNHDTALTLACAGGHEDLVDLLLQRGADIEHRDKKGFTPLILAATAGHEKVVEILLNHSADIEAQSERTKDTPLSLACSGGRYEVVDLLLSRGANREHRNVSDYTPLSLAASGGYVNIIKLLLSHGAEINSRTGSKLGISPLMLAAMNGHTAAVKLLLDMGSDINAQIETNRNTALTLACFQGRHEVVSLLLDRKANVEHRAKTGLTPLMEAASGGYVDVGRVLLDKGADVNATPVPSSRDTALTIAADKGHCRFVELLLSRGAAVEVKNKKGNSPLWLAANGGHLSVVELLYSARADIDSQDNRKVSCLMAAFRKGHTKVVKWMVNHVTQFPSDQEMIRYISTVSDKELLEKCQECVKIIRAAKETQAAKANKNASILLEELDMEKTREESKKAAAARRRERKKKKKLEKKEEKRKLYEENRRNESYDDKEDKKASAPDDMPEKADDEEASGDNSPSGNSPVRNGDAVDKEEGDSGIDANSQGSCSSNDVKAKEKRKEKKKKKNQPVKTENETGGEPARTTAASQSKAHVPAQSTDAKERLGERREASGSAQPAHTEPAPPKGSGSARTSQPTTRKSLLVFESSRHPADRDEFETTGNETYVAGKGKKSFIHYESDAPSKLGSSTSPKQTGKREEGWKEVVRKSSVQAVSSADAGNKKVSVPLNAISRVIGRGGSNINAIRGATGAHIEVEKQSKGQGERIITIKGSAEATKQAHSLIGALIKDPEVDILQMLPKNKSAIITSSLWDKTNAALLTSKKNTKVLNVSHSNSSSSGGQSKCAGSSAPASSAARSSLNVKISTCYAPSVTRGTAPRLVAAAEKRVAAQLAANTKNTMSYTSAIMTAGRGAAAAKTPTTPAPPSLVMTQTFAAKLTDSASTAPPSHPHHAHTSTPTAPPAASGTTSMLGAPPAGSAKPRSTQVGEATSWSASSHLGTPARFQNLNVPHTSSTAPTSPQAAQPAVSSAAAPATATTSISSPKHQHRPLPTASAPPSIAQYQTAGKAPFSSHGVGGSAPPDLHTSAVSIVNPATASTATSTPSVGGGSHSQSQSHGHGVSHAPCHVHADATSVPNLSQAAVAVTSATQEYSLFNESFTKLTQQSMWGRENDSLKPINFAAVTGGGISSQNASVIAPPKFMDSEPPQVDASKAPGYRGTTVCSPVSSKTSSSSTTPPSMPLAPGSAVAGNSAAAAAAAAAAAVVAAAGYHNFPEQSKSQAMGALAATINLNRPVSRPTGLELHPVPVAQSNTLDLGPNHFVGRGAVYPADVPVRSSGQSTESNLYKSVSASNYSADTASNLLKMVPNESQPPHNIMFHGQAGIQHHINFSQPQQTAQMSNTTVSMSRLNPRAPDFSLHNLPSKQAAQVTLFNTAGYHHSGVSSMPYPLKSSIGSYHSASRSNSGNSQNRWQYLPPSGYHPAQQQAAGGAQAPTVGQAQPQPDMLLPVGNMGHLRGLNLTHPGIDLLENGAMSAVSSSPAMSPNSPAAHNLAQTADQHHKMEDRKIPQPIGIERAWKIQNSGVPAPAAQDSADINWMMRGSDSKLAMSSWSSSCIPNMERQQQFFRSSFRMPTGDEITHIMDSYQHGAGSQLENQHVFQNGTVTAMNLMPPAGVPPLGQYAGPISTQDLIQSAAASATAEAMKIGEMPQWDGSRMSVTDITDKHAWKWNQ